MKSIETVAKEDLDLVSNNYGSFYTLFGLWKGGICVYRTYTLWFDEIFFFFFFFFFFSIFIALYLGLVVGEKHVYRKNGLSTRPLHIIHLIVF